MSKQSVIDHIISVEGGYVDDPSDSGGETNYGITVAVARASGYNGSMKEMPRYVAEGIYADKYWNSVKADQISRLSEKVAEEVVDTGVNMGVGRAARFLQRSLNVLNHQSRLYADLVVDGSIGPATLTALGGYLGSRDEDTLVKMLNCLQGAFYVELTERREKDERFIYGWFKNRVKV